VSRERELSHFLLLERREQEAAIRRLASSGMGDYGIAAASGLSVEQVRRVLAKRLAETSTIGRHP
jgi:ABC-type phosphate/phosphonate transport system ATPase subunit